MSAAITDRDRQAAKKLISKHDLNPSDEDQIAAMIAKGIIEDVIKHRFLRPSQAFLDWEKCYNAHLDGCQQCQEALRVFLMGNMCAEASELLAKMSRDL